MTDPNPRLSPNPVQDPSALAQATPLPFDNSYAALPDRFFARVAPTPVEAPVVIAFNRALAAELGLDAEALAREAGAVFSGNRVPEGAAPLAMAYAGHQFGNFVPQLGDGRAILLGEVVDGEGRRRDIQLKGAGPTPFSRRGDGRAALGPVMREYLVSEAMHALGIPATRALAAVVTGEPVYRETVLPGAVLTRVAASHLRVGTFQFFAARDDREGLQRLTDYAIARHDPDLKQAEIPALALIERVAARQADLIARWLGVGFIHGVMNTDNFSISGETLDFGPCAFLDTYDPRKVFSSIDRGGRYAYASQPGIAQWNLARLAECLLPLIDADGDKAVEKASAVINAFPARFQAAWLATMRAKLGLTTEEDGDLDLIQAFLALLHEGEADYTLAFRALADAVTGDATALAERFRQPVALSGWLEAWRARLAREPGDLAARSAAMRKVNPLFIPRNHRIEQAIASAQEDGDFSLFEALQKALSRPFDDQPEHAPLAEAPREEERVTRTFCGT
ncbi:protein adenylyltransferase SelO [Rhizobium rhizosphaerae]|uniref:protein adenylyltransferase SelO n=1 Tax=Xaviernesmea rhizosphaerae TaxID=1672749 RepID=UPI0009BF9027|nr:YdiU family protein [Xaviernesmea rhizosphaerae]